VTLPIPSYQGKITKNGLKNNYGRLIDFLIQILKLSYINMLALADVLMHH